MAKKSYRPDRDGKAAASYRKNRKIILESQTICGICGQPVDFSKKYPDPNGLMDLWAEIFVLDGGERLERTVTRFRQLYFRPGKSNGHVVYDWTPVDGFLRNKTGVLLSS